MRYKHTKQLRKDLASAGLLDILSRPDVLVRGYLDEGELKQWEPNGPQSRRQTSRTTGLSQLLAVDVWLAENRGWEPIRLVDDFSRSAWNLADAVGHICHVERRLPRAAKVKNIARLTTDARRDLDHARHRLAAGWPAALNGPDVTAAADQLRARADVAEAALAALAGAADTKAAVLANVRAQLVPKPQQEHIALDDHQLQEVLIGTTYPVNATIAAVEVIDTLTIATDAGRQRILRAPAYVRDYLVQEGTPYAHCQIVNDPSALDDPAMRELAINLWDPRDPGAMCSLNAVIATLRHARA